VTTAPDAAAVRAACTRVLSYDPPQSARDVLRSLVAYARDDLEHDNFGTGAIHDQLERRVCDILGKEAAIFFPAGRVAQLATLKALCEMRGDRRVAMHPRCHLQEYEDRAYDHVYGLTAVTLGEPNRPNHAADLDEVRDPLGAIALEVPLLSLGCRAPSWSELTCIASRARERGIPIHLDGARLWEVAPWYGRSHREIASLFDTVSVSFYKSLGAMAGGAVAGPADVIALVRRWQQRLGAAPFQMFPLVLDALRGLQERLHLVPRFHERAVEIAAALSGLPGVFVNPDPPHATSMQVLLRGDPQRLITAALEVSSRTGIWLVDFSFPAPLAGYAMFPVTVASGALEIADDEVRDAIVEVQRLMSAEPRR